jgi:hypothetical protein
MTAASSYATINAVGGGFFINPYGVAADANGNVFATDASYGTVREISSIDGFSTVATPAFGLNVPIGVALDTADDVFVADTYNNAVKEFSQAAANLVLCRLAAAHQPSQ